MPSPLCHFDIVSGDTGRTKSFYQTVFNWQFDDQSMPGYSLVNAGAEPTGGVMQKPETSPGPCLNVYFQVKDIDTTLAKANENGAKTIVPKTPIPGVGNFAIFADPDGIAIGIMQPDS